MGEITININARVTVTLTRYGMRRRDAYYQSIGLGPERRRELKCELPPGPTITEPLWSLFQMFGPEIYHGMPEMPFVRNELRIEVE